MTGRERVFAAVRGGKPDCCPVTPYDGNFCLRHSGYAIGDCYTDAATMAKGQQIGRDKTGQDTVNVQSEQYYICEALGVKTQLHKEALPSVLDVPVKELSDVEKLRVPDVDEGRMPVYIDAVRLLHEHYQGEVAIRACGTGPFTIAGHLMGLENFLTAIMAAEVEEDEESQQYLLHMIDICTDTLIRFATACVQSGADIIQNADSLASMNMISPTIYKKYAWPFERKFFAAMDKLKPEHDFLKLLHICGNNSLVSPLMADTGCDIMIVDSKMDFDWLCKTVNNKVCLMGNLNPAATIYLGTPEQVQAEARATMEIAARNHARFCLGSGCEVAVDAPVENVRAMVEAGHAWKMN